MKRKLIRVATGVAVLMSGAVLVGGSMVFMLFGITMRMEPAERTLPTLESVPREYWTTLAEKRIFFGHRSVGYNVLDGIREIVKEHAYIRLNIVETSGLGERTEPLLAHCKIGENDKPLTKISAFASELDRNQDAGIDIALMKLCYVDVIHRSDVESIFHAYRDTIEQLEKRHPKVKIIHATVPLRAVYTGPKWRVRQSFRRLFGRPTIVDDNDQRNKYNELLREAYSEDGTVYDLALAESTDVHGRSCYVKKSKEKVPFLCLEYSADGGHLNALGKRRAAEQLLIMLAKVANE